MASYHDALGTRTGGKSSCRLCGQAGGTSWTWIVDCIYPG